MLRDNWQSVNGLIGIVDYANEPFMGLQSSTTNTDYYGDGTHPGPYGYKLLAQFAATEIQRILNI